MCNYYTFRHDGSKKFPAERIYMRWKKEEADKSSTEAEKYLGYGNTSSNGGKLKARNQRGGESWLVRDCRYVGYRGWSLRQQCLDGGWECLAESISNMMLGVCRVRLGEMERDSALACEGQQSRESSGTTYPAREDQKDHLHRSFKWARQGQVFASTPTCRAPKDNPLSGGSLLEFYRRSGCGRTLYVLTRQQDPFGDPQISGDHGIPSLVPSLSSSFLLHSILFVLSEDEIILIFSFLTQESEFSSLMFGRHIRLVDIRSFLSALYSLFRSGQVNAEFPLSFLFALPFRFGQASIESSHSPFRFGQIVGLSFSAPYLPFRSGQCSCECKIPFPSTLLFRSGQTDVFASTPTCRAPKDNPLSGGSLLEFYRRSGVADGKYERGGTIIESIRYFCRFRNSAHELSHSALS
ncbi:hypothetical protein M5K25_012319 [Dendrobium thyrsiflorum]|uniref:Uncharacterized protein n=1 Tax=Dendrobium thyrsiflorum TaxID=117978 RepID=A0ABD0UWN9_DENTH